jgi:uncharacterized protein (TIGR03663 family)
VLAVAAAVAASGFVVATVACVLVACAVVFDARRLPGDAFTALTGRLRAKSTLFARLFVVFVAAVVFLYAPRGGSVGLWSPATVPQAVAFVFGEAPGRFFAVRVASRYADGATHPLVPYVTSLVRTLLAAALPTVALGVVGALSERYVGADRTVVAFFSVWAAAAVLLFPTVAEVDAPWTAVHVVVPLAVPAAVGAGRGVAYARAAVSRADAPAVAAVLLVAVAGVAQVGGVLASDVYGPPTPDGALTEYGQPADDLEPFAANVSAAGGGEPAVLYYGDRFHTGEWTVADGPPVPTAWGGQLPLPWYVARERAEATTRASNATLPANPPPVVVVDPADAGAVEPRLSGYERSRYRLGLWDRDVVVFVRV